MTFFSLKLFPLIASGPKKPQKLTASKINKFWTKSLNFLLKNGYFGPIIFQEIEFLKTLSTIFYFYNPKKF